VDSYAGNAEGSQLQIDALVIYRKCFLNREYLLHRIWSALNERGHLQKLFVEVDTGSFLTPANNIYIPMQE